MLVDFPFWFSSALAKLVELLKIPLGIELSDRGHRSRGRLYVVLKQRRDIGICELISLKVELPLSLEAPSLCTATYLPEARSEFASGEGCNASRKMFTHG